LEQRIGRAYAVSDRIRTRRGEDDRHMWVTATHVVGDIEPISTTGHMDIGDQQGESRGWLLDQGNRVLAVLSLADIEALLIQLLCQHKADQQLVLDKKNAHVFGPA
jgi:hypothetical protein